MKILCVFSFHFDSGMELYFDNCFFEAPKVGENFIVWDQDQVSWLFTITKVTKIVELEDDPDYNVEIHTRNSCYKIRY